MDELGQLPHPGHYERACRSFAFLFSYAVQGGALLVLVICGLIQPPQSLQLRRFEVADLISVPPSWQRTPPDELRWPSAALPQAAVAEVPNSTVAAPVPLRLRGHRSEMEENNRAPQLAFASEPAVPIPMSRTATAAAVVHTGAFASSASPVASRSQMRPSQIQTGGFGDPNGIPAHGHGTSKRTIAGLGRFDLPSGPGYGNGTGGAHGRRAVVPNSGFGDIDQTSKTSTITVRTSVPAFTANVFPGVLPESKQTGRPKLARPPEFTPLEVLSKPKPTYSDEARKLKIEGEVILEVIFTASGQVQVLRTVRGLGHGLDEAALRAAQDIRFKPAAWDREPVDTAAALHVIFQLAY